MTSLLLMLISPMLSLSLPLGQGTSGVSGCESVVWTCPCWNYLLPIRSWIQHSRWAGFINFFLILGVLPSVSVAQKFGFSVPLISRTSFCLSSGNFPRACPAPNLNKSILLTSNFPSNTWTSSPLFCKTKPKKKLSQLVSFLIHSASLWWTSFLKWNEVKWLFVQWWHLHNPDFVPRLFNHLYD